MLKKISVISINVFALLYGIFAFIYGAIYVSLDLRQTIMFNTEVEALAARNGQILYGTPFIVIGIVIICSLGVYYVLRKSRAGFIAWQINSGAVICIGFVYFVVTTAIALFLKQKALLICIVAALLYMVYGVYTKVKHNKVYIVNHTIDEGNTAEGEDKI